MLNVQANFVELKKDKSFFNTNDCSFSLCHGHQNTKIPSNSLIRQPFYLQKEEKEKLFNAIPPSVTDILYETYYDTCSFDFMRENLWIKRVSASPNEDAEKEYIIKRVKEETEEYIEYSEETTKELEFRNVTPFLTFKVVREIRKFEGYSIQSETVNIDNEPHLSDPELYNEKFIKKWHYTLFTYCSDKITNKEVSNTNCYKPLSLARSTLFKYMDIFEPELYCDIQDLGFIRQDELYHDCEKNIYDDIDMKEFVKELNEHRNGW